MLITNGTFGGTLIIYLSMVFFSIFIPIYIFKRTRILKELSAILGMFLFIGLVNTYSILGTRLKLPQHSFFYEAHEVLWVLVPVVIYIICIYMEKKVRKA
jgi:hypothetical protein